MARSLDQSQASSSKSRRQQEDQRRMEFRRAIEDLSEQRRLIAETADYPIINYWRDASFGDSQSALPGR